jgi:hypothetical protein
MATSIMNMPPLPKGMWWWNVAPIGSKPVWEQRPMPKDVSPDQIDTIFGYDTKAFLRRQYKD